MSIFLKFIPKKDDFFGVKKLIQSTSAFDLFSYQKKDESFSVFKYHNKKIAKKIANILKSVKSIHVMNVLNAKEGSIYTSPIIPLESFNENFSDSYKEYLLITLRKTISFLNEKCQIRHNNITRESLFIDRTGSLVLCGFEKAEHMNELNDFQSDCHQFDDFTIEFIGQQQNIQDLIEEENFYVSLFSKSVTISVMKDQEMIEFLNSFMIEHNENIILHITREYIGKLILDRFIESKELKADQVPFDLENKVRRGVIDSFDHPRYIFFYFILFIDLKEYDSFFLNFISVLDTTFRLEVLKKYTFFIERVSTWSEKPIFANLIMGLRCRDHQLQIQTIKILKHTLPTYKHSQIKETTKLLSFCKFEETVALLDEHAQIFVKNDQKGFLKLFFVLLDVPEIRVSTLALLRKNFSFFEIKKICTVLLPFLCELIIETPSDDLFDTIRSILNHLQKNKDAIESIEIKTRFQKWLPFMKNTKQNQKTASTSDKESVDEQDQWENDW